MRCGLVLLFRCAATAADPDQQELKRDSGKYEGKQSVAVSGHVISFRKPAGQWWIRAVRVYGVRYGFGYDGADAKLQLTVCDRKLRSLVHTEDSYRRFRRKFTWTEIPLPQPVEAPAEFKIAIDFQPTRDKGVYVGYSKAARSHSGYGRPGGRLRPLKGKDWMIRVLVSKTKDGPLESVPGWERRIRRNLAERRGPTLRMEGTTAQAAAGRAAAISGEPVVIDPVVLEQLHAQEPVISVKQGEATGREILNALFLQTDLITVVRWEVAFLTTAERRKQLPRAAPEGPAGMLKKRVDLEFRGLRLTEVVQQLSKASGVKLELRLPEGTEQPRVHVRAADIELRHALALLLYPRGLTFEVQNRTVVITSKK